MLNLLGITRVLVAFVLFLFYLFIEANDKNRGKYFLVFVGSYSGSPSSVFGHIFLLHLGDDKEFHLANAYGLNAIVDPNTSMMDYIVQGLGGGFRAQISSDQFYKFVAKYQGVEDRDIYIFKLNKDIDNSDFKKIIDQYNKKNISYYFRGHNCTTFLRETINTVHHTKKRKEDYPYLLIRDLLDENFISLVEYHESQLIKLNNSYATLDYVSKKKVKRIVKKIQSGETDYYEELTPLEKSFFSSYYDYKSANLENLNTLRKYLSFVGSYSKSNTKTINLKEISEKIRQSHSPRLFKLGILTSGEQEFAYRHSLHSQSDGEFLYGYHDAFNLLHIEAEISEDKMRIRRISLLDHLSVADFNFLTKKFSSYFSVFHENFSVGTRNNKATGFTFGKGISFTSEDVQLSVLVTTSLERYTARVGFVVGGKSFFTYSMSRRSYLSGSMEYKKNTENGINRIIGILGSGYRITRDFSSSVETRMNTVGNSKEMRHKLALHFYF